MQGLADLGQLDPTQARCGWVEDGAENELRHRRRLWADPTALAGLRALGLSDLTIRRFRMGLNEPVLSRSGRLTEHALAFPVLRPDGSRAGRWSFLALDGVTREAPHPVAWTPGGARTFYSRTVTQGSTLLLVSSPLDVFLVWQALGDALGSIVIAASTVPGVMPTEWRDQVFWRDWDRVVLGLSERNDDDDVARSVARIADRDLVRCAPPPPETWSDMVRLGASAAEVRRLIEDAKPFIPVETVPSVESGPAIVGDFQAEPVCVEGALVAGRLHYPVTMERRGYENRGAGVPVLVQRYVVRVLRSDGMLLDVERLPAPAGTPEQGRVLALSDGTRIVSAPLPGRFGSWSFPSIRRFMEARSAGDEPERRSLPRLLADIECHLRSSVWLPHAEDYALAALFVAGTFVHRAFDAFPILLVNGPRGSGKSELGQAMAAVACNAVVAGRVTPAGLVRLLSESRGLVVLDDLESIAGARGGADDVSQILKVGYKASTARRVSPGRDGRVEVLDFYAPKLVTNIAGADPVLMSRMVSVRTGPMPADASCGEYGIDARALRDELHVWAMCEVGDIRQAYVPIAAEGRSRRDEIAAPLRAIAVLGGGDWPDRLEGALHAEPPEAAEPAERVLARAVSRLAMEEGVVSVAMPRLVLEMAATARGSLDLPSAETLGRMLIALGARERDGAVERRRLHGEVTRIYALSSRYLASVGRPAVEPPEPFAFCRTACAVCRYDAVCGAAVPWLRPARVDRAGDRDIAASGGVTSSE